MRFSLHSEFKITTFGEIRFLSDMKIEEDDAILRFNFVEFL